MSSFFPLFLRGENKVNHEQMKLFYAIGYVGTYHRKYNPVPPATIGTRSLLRMSLVFSRASSKNCPTE